MRDTSLALSIHVSVLSINDNAETGRDVWTLSIPNYTDMREKHCIS